LESSTDCRSEEGITTGLVDSLITICRILAKRDLSPLPVQEALVDYFHEEDVDAILNASYIAAKSVMT